MGENEDPRTRNLNDSLDSYESAPPITSDPEPESDIAICQTDNEHQDGSKKKKKKKRKKERDTTQADNIEPVPLSTHDKSNDSFDGSFDVESGKKKKKKRKRESQEFVA